MARLTRHRLNEHQETRYLFNKLHVENECVLEILQGAKVNIFGQKARSVAGMCSSLTAPQKLKKEDAQTVEQAAIRAQVSKDNAMADGFLRL
jgi:hypothetical protein